MSRPAPSPRAYVAVMVFDLDDTLYLERDYVESGLAAVGRWAATQLGVAGLGPEMIDRFRRGARGKIFNEALRRAGVADSPELVARMIAVYRRHRPRISFQPDALRFLSRCPADTALAIITDGYLEAQRSKLRALDVHRHGVRLAVCTDRWGPSGWKPSRLPFVHTEAFFGLHGPALTYVADNPAKDFHAPRELGWRTVQITRPLMIEKEVPRGAVPAEIQLTSFDALDI